MSNLLNDDLFIVERGTTPYKVKWEELIINAGENAKVAVEADPPVGADEGDLWFCTTDGRLYIYYTDPNGTSQWIDASPDGGTGGSDVTTSATPPTDPAEGDLWYSTSDARLYIYYRDADTVQWVDASPAGAGGGGSGPEVGDLQSVTDNGNTTDNTINAYITDGTRGFNVGPDASTSVVRMGRNSINQDGSGGGGYISARDVNGVNGVAINGDAGSITAAGNIEAPKIVSLSGGSNNYIVQLDAQNDADANQIEVINSNGTAFGVTGSGSITAAGNVQVGDNAPAAGSYGVKLYPSGNVHVSREASETNPVFQATDENANYTTQIFSDGSATFLGNGRFKRSLALENGYGAEQSGGAALFVRTWQNAETIAKINYDGTAVFGSNGAQVDLGPQDVGTSGERGRLEIKAPAAAGDGAASFVISRGADQNVRMNTDGTARLAGSVNVGPNTGSVSQDKEGIGLGSAGTVSTYVSSTSDGNANAFAVLKTTAAGGGTVWSVKKNGASTFTGNVTTPNLTFRLDDGTTMDVKRVGTALKALKAAAIAASDFNTLKSAIVTALADIDTGGSY